MSRIMVDLLESVSLNGLPVNVKRKNRVGPTRRHR
jgi:hypothetical protein